LECCQNYFASYFDLQVILIAWHPSAQNILMSVAADPNIIIWNVETGEELFKMVDVFPDLIQSASWNYDGSQIVTTCKDKTIRVFDSRTGEVLQVRAFLAVGQ